MWLASGVGSSSPFRSAIVALLLVAFYQQLFPALYVNVSTNAFVARHPLKLLWIIHAPHNEVCSRRKGAVSGVETCDSVVVVVSLFEHADRKLRHVLCADELTILNLCCMCRHRAHVDRR